MGEVWRATDTKLHRDVAIKLLPNVVARDPERLARLEREAQLLASLNHPNIAAIHGLEEADGTPFLVLELVPGEDLALRLKRGPLPVDEAIDVARQIAEALEEAHERGVVHRDLKPGNVKVTPDGKVKVLDFGLAKAWSPDPSSGSAPDLSQSPTLAHTGTAAGVILGTAAYMSPEQARGKAVDKRSDIWSFGALLHELLAGQPLFAGETVSDVLAAVLTREPDWRALPVATPASVRRLLERCLERDPKRRLRDIGEARIALSEPALAQAQREAAARPESRRETKALWPALALAAALAFAAGYLLRRAPAPAPEAIGSDTTVRQLTFEPGLEAEPSFSPDGNYLAYTTNDRGSLDVVVMPVDGGELRRVAATPADEAQPAWSPDGTRIAFVSAQDHGRRLGAVAGINAMSPFVQGIGADVFIVPSAGGPAVKLVEHGAQPAWTPDGRSIVFSSDRKGHWDIWTVASDGGEPRALTDDIEIDYQPAVSPDGKWIAFASVMAPNQRHSLRVIPAGGGGPARDVPVPGGMMVSPAWSADGSFIYLASTSTPNAARTSLWRMAFPGDAGHPAFQRVTLGEATDTNPAPAARGRRLAFARASNAPDLFELDVKSGAVRQITATSCLEDYPQLSPDGRTLLFFSDRASQSGLYTLNLDGSGLQPVTPPGIASTLPRWSPDGKRFAFVRQAETGWSIVVQPVGGLSVTTLVKVPPATGMQAPHWSPDGRSLVFSQAEPGGHRSIRVVDLAGAVREVVAPGGVVMFPAWSPDGRRIAFQREKDGPREIWAVPAEGGEAAALSKSTLELSHPEWCPTDPDTILVVLEHKNLATLSAATGVVTPITRYDDSTVYVDYPSWSFDGRKIYFAMSRRIGDLYLLENP
jgi:Tol biopolymer transport system component